MKPKSRLSDDLSIVGISKPISQTESKRLPQVMPILEYLLENNSVFSVGQLVKSTKVSRDSIDRTIRILEQKEIIKLKEKKARGEKFYEIKSQSELKSLYETLRQWWLVKILFKNKVQKGTTKLKKTMILNTKKAMRSSRLVSESDQKKQLWFVSKARQQQITTIPHPNPVIIWDLPFSQAVKIMKSHWNGLLCEICFKESKISFLTTHSGEQVCELGHVTPLQSTGDFSSHSHIFTRKRSKSISDSEFKAQRDEILLGKTRKSRSDDDE